MRRVRSHVGDVAALVERLGGTHRLLGPEAEPRRRGLLERAGDEGRRRLAGRALFLDAADGERRAIVQMAGEAGVETRRTFGVGVFDRVVLVEDKAEQFGGVAGLRLVGRFELLAGY